MRNTITCCMLIALSVLSSCSSAQTISSNKILIVYLSRSSNTKAVAEIIHKKVGGTLVPLELTNPYPKDYQMTVNQVGRENETGFLPPLATKIDNIEKYDIVFIGFPTWGMRLPPPMNSFLHQYDLGGKKIIPFNTNGGYGTGSSFQTVKQLCPNGEVADGFSIKGGLERDGIYLAIKGDKAVEAEKEIGIWLKKIKML